MSTLADLIIPPIGEAGLPRKRRLHSATKHVGVSTKVVTEALAVAQSIFERRNDSRRTVGGPPC